MRVRNNVLLHLTYLEIYHKESDVLKVVSELNPALPEVLKLILTLGCPIFGCLESTMVRLVQEHSHFQPETS